MVQRAPALRAERSGLLARDDRRRALALAVRSAPKWSAATSQIQVRRAAVELRLVATAEFRLVAAAQATEAATRAVRRPVPGLIADRPSKRRPTQNRQAKSPYTFSNASLPPPNAHNMRLRERPNVPEWSQRATKVPYSLSIREI
jgi:hypothetical protein